MTTQRDKTKTNEIKAGTIKAVSLSFIVFGVVSIFLFLFTVPFISAETFGYGHTEDIPINYSNIVINETSNMTNCWSTAEGIKCDVSDITYDEISGGDVNADGYTGFFDYLGDIGNRILELWVTDINADGNITANTFFGDGSGLTNIETEIWTKDLVLDMPFQAGSPTKDYSAYQNHGITVGDMVWNATGGYNGYGAYLFDNSDDRITILDSASLDLEDNFTYSAWIYPNDFATDYIFMRPASYYLAILNTGEVSVNTYSGAGWGVQIDSTTDYTIDAWNHIVVVMGQDGDATIYINGEFAGSGSNGYSGKLSDNNLTIGGFEGGSSLFDGYIDEVMLWDKALTEKEVKNIYNLRRKEPHFNELIVDGNVTANYFFGSGANLGDLNVSGILNVTGDFTGYAINISYLQGAGGIGGMDLRGDPWYLGGTDLEITNNLTVYTNLYVEGNATVDGLINGINISNLSNEYVPYEGAVRDVNISPHGLETGQLNITNGFNSSFSNGYISTGIINIMGLFDVPVLIGRTIITGLGVYEFLPVQHGMFLFGNTHEGNPLIGNKPEPGILMHDNITNNIYYNSFNGSDSRVDFWTSADGYYTFDGWVNSTGGGAFGEELYEKDDDRVCTSENGFCNQTLTETDPYWSGNQSNYYNKTEVDTNISNANTSMKNYVDSQDIVYNNSMKSYVDNLIAGVTGLWEDDSTYLQPKDTVSQSINVSNINVENNITKNNLVIFYSDENGGMHGIAQL